MPRVALYHCPEYDLAVLREIVEKCLDLRRFSPGEKILVKANMLAARAPERAVTTHPALAEAVCAGLLDRGCRPTLADSPGIEPFSLIARVSGLSAVGAKLGIPVKELSRSTVCPPSKVRVHARLELSADVLEADAVVSLPKLKTHCQMQLSMAVKNLFGCVVGPRKAQWHYAVGLDRSCFADVLLDIAQSVPPLLSIVDGIVGMEGHGPSNGRPRAFGLIAAGTDPVQLDAALAAMMGLPGDDYLLLRRARERNIGDWGLNDVEWTGDFDPTTRFDAVDVPAMDALSLMPRFMDSFGRRFLASRPVQDESRCVVCGRCAQVCPAKAITIDGKKLRFDYAACIRCYCCQEMCPHNALQLREGVLMKLLQAFGIAKR